MSFLPENYECLHACTDINSGIGNLTGGICFHGFLAHTPFQLVVGPRREGGALDDLAHLLTAEAEIVDGPHVRELHHFDLVEGQKLSEAEDARPGDGETVRVSILPACNTSSRPRARRTFPQGEGDSGLLTLPA